MHDRWWHATPAVTERTAVDRAHRIDDTCQHAAADAGPFAATEYGAPPAVKRFAEERATDRRSELIVDRWWLVLHQRLPQQRATECVCRRCPKAKPARS